MTFIPDSNIDDKETLYRAIHPTFWNEDEDRPTSAVFKDAKGVSVDRDGNRIEQEIVDALLLSRYNYGVGNINAGEALSIGAYLKPDKLPDNHYHAIVQASETKIKLSNSVAKKLTTILNVIQTPKL